MEKLVELLNEYEVIRIKEANNKEEVGNLDRYTPYRYTKQVIEGFSNTIISKKFGFIERLVEQDYINMNKVERDAISYFTDESPVYGDKIWTTRLIMMLSVSNDPIKDLIYYLGKEDDDNYIKPGGYKLVFNANKS